MKKRLSSLTYAASLSLLFMACSNNATTKASATDSPGTDTASKMPPTATPDATAQNPDAALVHELIESMYAGIALMKDGEQKATDPAVKSLAQKLDTEHSKLTKELEDLSNKKGWALPAGEPAADKQNREAMGKEDVSQFQKDWLASLRSRHETNIGKLENAEPTDPDVKAAGEKGLPKVKELLAEIKKVQNNLK